MYEIKSQCHFFPWSEVNSLSRVQLFETPWTVAYQAPPSKGFSLLGILPPWDFPGKSTRVGCHFLLQGIFLTQGLNPDLPHSRQTLNLWATREAQYLSLGIIYLPPAHGFCFHKGRSTFVRHQSSNLGEIFFDFFILFHWSTSSNLCQQYTLLITTAS